jgi:hypothetical protein
LTKSYKQYYKYKGGEIKMSETGERIEPSTQDINKPVKPMDSVKPIREIEPVPPIGVKIHGKTETPQETAEAGKFKAIIGDGIPQNQEEWLQHDLKVSAKAEARRMLDIMSPVAINQEIEVWNSSGTHQELIAAIKEAREQKKKGGFY